MKRFLTNILLFPLFSSIFYIGMLFLWDNYAPSLLKSNLNYRIGSYGHMFTRLNEVKNLNNNDLDILFLGASCTYRGFDTRIFKKSGYNTFNLGSSGQSPIQTHILLKRYLERINPKLIIYEVSPLPFACDGIESSLDIIANDKNDSYSYDMAFKLNHIKTYNTLLYGTIRELFNLNNSFIEPIKKDNGTYISGGYVEKEIKYFNPVQFPDEEIVINQSQLASFTESMSYLKGKNIDVILVFSPISSSRYLSYSNNSYFDSIMKNYSEYYNFNEILSLDDSLHFYDSYHLNQNGVEIFNKKLIDILNKR